MDTLANMSCAASVLATNDCLFFFYPAAVTYAERLNLAELVTCEVVYFFHCQLVSQHYFD